MFQISPLTRFILDAGILAKVLKRLALIPLEGSNVKQRPTRSKLAGIYN